MPPIDENRRGSVLIHVLVTGVVVALIAAGVLRMTLVNYSTIARANTAAQNRKEADAMLSRAMTAWNASTSVCSGVSGMTCTGMAGVCNCTCTDIGCASPPCATIRAVPAGASCALTITSSNPP